jgi:hypothetical protein
MLEAPSVADIVDHDHSPPLQQPITQDPSSSSSCVAERPSFACGASNMALPPMTVVGTPALGSLLTVLDDLVDAYVTTLYTCIVLVYLLWQYRLKQSKLQRRKRLEKADEDEIAAAKKEAQRLLQQGLAEEEKKQEDEYEELPDNIGDFNLTGTYKMISNENMDAFLTVQGVPWPLRRAAAGVMPNHHITHIKNRLTIRIHAAGLLETTTTYTIGGPTVETTVRGRLFRDHVAYKVDPNTQKVHGIQTKKTAVTEGYVVTVLRVLSDDRNTIYMTSSASFPNDPTKADVVSQQVFSRISETSC